MKRYLPHIALTLFLAQLLLLLVSWLYSAAFPADPVRSLLSGEGVRWFFGHYARLLGSPLLVWIVLLSLAWGCVAHCGVLHSGNSYRERRAHVITLLYLIIYIGVVLSMSVIPHAVLLSATGALWPSPFSASLVPITAFGILSAAVVYGTVAGNYQSLADVYESLLVGIRQAAPLLLFYVLLAQFYYSLRFVFC